MSSKKRNTILEILTCHFHFAELQVKPERRLDYPKKSLLKETQINSLLNLIFKQNYLRKGI